MNRKNCSKLVTALEALTNDKKAIFMSHWDCKVECMAEHRGQALSKEKGVSDELLSENDNGACVEGVNAPTGDPQVPDPIIPVLTPPYAMEFMHLPTREGLHKCQSYFIEAISADTVQEVICATCVLLCWEWEVTIMKSINVPNLHNL